TRWPGKHPSAENVEVHMKYGLPPLFVAIDHVAKARLGDAFRPGNFIGPEEHPPDKGLVFRTDLCNAGDVLAGNNKTMRRGPGVNIPEGVELAIGIDFGRGYVPRRNLTKQTVFGHDGFS